MFQLFLEYKEFFLRVMSLYLLITSYSGGGGNMKSIFIDILYFMQYHYCKSVSSTLNNEQKKNGQIQALITRVKKLQAFCSKKHCLFKSSLHLFLERLDFLLVAHYFLFVACQFFSRRSLLSACCSVLCAHCSLRFCLLVVSFCSLLVTFCSLLVARYFLLVDCYFLLVTRYSLLFVRYFFVHRML